VVAFAAMSVLPEDQAFKTIGLNVQFFRGSRNERITIEARVVAQSRQLIAVEADFRNPGGDLLAKATAQQMLVPIPKQP
jgi:acyl-coenzyme A thioesterase PaaI-like protein